MICAMLRVRPSSLALALVLVSLGACQPLEPIVPADAYCEEQTTVLDGTDAEAPSGLRVADFIDRVTGARTVDLEYRPPMEDDAVYVDIGPPDPMTTVDLELNPELGDIRWIDAEAIYPPGSDPNQPLDCASRFEFEASLSFASADGVFAELFEATVEARVDDSGALDYLGVPIPFEPEDLAGSFEVVSVQPSNPDPSFVLHELWVEFPLEGDPASAAEARGYVGGVAEYDFIDFYAIGVFHIATFGGYVLD